MKCNEIVELSIRHINNSLNEKSKSKFLKHILRCNDCNGMYNLLKVNYQPSDTSIDNPSETIEKIMSKIDKERYSEKYKEKNYFINNRSNKRPRLKWLAVCLSVIIFAAASVNAGTIYKSLEELLNTIGVEVNLKAIGQYKKTEKQKEMELSDRIYLKNKQAIIDAAANMQPGQVKELSFTKGSDILNVKIAKGKETQTISCSVNGGSFFIKESPFGEFYDNTPENETLLQTLIANGYFVPEAKNMPEGYNLDNIMYSDKEVIALHYRSGTGSNNISISLVGRVVKNPEVSKRLLTVNGYQAVYQEVDLYGKTNANITIYLGDDKRQDTLSVSSFLSEEDISEAELLHIAEGILLHNADNNYDSRLDYIVAVNMEGSGLESSRSKKDEVYSTYTLDDVLGGGCFKSIKDTQVKEKVNEYIDLVAAGKKEFTIPVSDSLSVKRSEKAPWQDPRYFMFIEYTDPDLSTITGSINYPILMSRHIMEKTIVKQVVVTFPELNATKSNPGVHYMLHPIDSEKYASWEVKPVVTVDINSIHAEDEHVIREYSLYDFMFNRHHSTNYIDMDANFVCDSKGVPYIVTRHKKFDIVTIRTIKEIEGSLMQYIITIPNVLLSSGLSDEQLVEDVGLIH